MPVPILFFVACRREDPPSPPGPVPTTTTSETEARPPLPGGTADAQIPCATAGTTGLAVRVWWPRSDLARHDGRAPVFVRVGGAGWTGWDLGHTPGLATRQGAAVVQFLRPGTRADDGTSSGGIDDAGGPGVAAALQCVVAFVRGELEALDGTRFADRFAAGGLVLGTGLSLGGAHVLNTHAAGVDLDGLVLWESPLTDPITLREFAPEDEVVDGFVEGTCSLDGGCPCPDRLGLLRYAEGGYVWTDLDGDAVYDEGEEPKHRPIVDAVGGKAYFSRFMHADLEAGGDAVFVGVGGVPADWPTVAEIEAFWSGWEATAALVSMRDQGTDTPVMVLASGEDHVQLLHEHTRVAMEGAQGASFFRLNPDVAYLSALGDDTGQEFPAGVRIDDPAVLDSLADPREDDQVLAAELELADRLADGVWSADLTEPIRPVQ